MTSVNDRMKVNVSLIEHGESQSRTLLGDSTIILSGFLWCRIKPIPGSTGHGGSKLNYLMIHIHLLQDELLTIVTLYSHVFSGVHFPAYPLFFLAIPKKSV